MIARVFSVLGNENKGAGSAIFRYAGAWEVCYNTSRGGRRGRAVSSVLSMGVCAMKKTIRILVSVFLVICLISGMTAAMAAAPSTDNFTTINTYRRGMFPDVDETLWYGFDNQKVIKSCYELGIMQGSGVGFEPEASLTAAQAVAMSARVRSIYEGDGKVFEQGDPWYQVYFDYVEEKGIIPAYFFWDSENEPISRADMAYIFARTLPESELAAINEVTSLPDVDEGDYFCGEVLRLYCAGVLTGNDQYGTFYPYDNVNRAQAAAIISRLALPEKRVSLSLTAVSQWLTGYTNSEVIEYFILTAFNAEYNGEREMAIRWNEPILYSVSGDPSAEDLATVNALCARLNSIEGFPGIRLTEEWNANLKIRFVSENDFVSIAGANAANSWGFANVSYWNSDGGIYDGYILIADEMPTRLARDSVIYEECLQSLGLLYDSYWYYESVFYQDSNEQGVPAEIDWAIVQLLYHPDMPQGGTAEECRAAAVEIIAGLTGAA